MSEQQDHLANLLQQRQTLIDEINGLQQQAAEKRELLLRASGAIEYLTQIGVKLPDSFLVVIKISYDIEYLLVIPL